MRIVDEIKEKSNVKTSGPDCLKRFRYNNERLDKIDEIRYDNERKNGRF